MSKCLTCLVKGSIDVEDTDIILAVLEDHIHTDSFGVATNITADEATKVYNKIKALKAKLLDIPTAQV